VLRFDSVAREKKDSRCGRWVVVMVRRAVCDVYATSTAGLWPLLAANESQFFIPPSINTREGALDTRSMPQNARPKRYGRQGRAEIRAFLLSASVKARPLCAAISCRRSESHANHSTPTDGALRCSAPRKATHTDDPLLALSLSCGPHKPGVLSETAPVTGLADGP